MYNPEILAENTPEPNIQFQKGLKEPYDWDEYAEMFFPKARELARIAEISESQGEKAKASEYFLYVNQTGQIYRSYMC